MATAEQELTEVRRLRDRTRSRAHGGVWFPVAVLALLLLTSIALYRSPFRELHEATVTVPYWAGLPAEQRSPIASYLLWLVGTPVAFALIAAWYRRRARRHDPAQRPTDTAAANRHRDRRPRPCRRQPRTGARRRLGRVDRMVPLHLRRDQRVPRWAVPGRQLAVPHPARAVARRDSAAAAGLRGRAGLAGTRRHAINEQAHPSLARDETVHQRVRLGILAVLSETTECTFAVLREELDLTDGNLSRHLRVLEEAG